MQNLIETLKELGESVPGLTREASMALEALGGRRALVALGASRVRDLKKSGSSGSGNKKLSGVGVMWPNKKRSKGNYVELYVNDRDEYQMDFYNVSMRGVKKVKSFGTPKQGLPLENIRPTFEKQTGWYLRM